MDTITIEASDLEVTGTWGNKLRVNLTVEKSQVLGAYEIADAVNHYGSDDLLAAIGEEKAREYFGWTE